MGKSLKLGNGPFKQRGDNDGARTEEGVGDAWLLGEGENSRNKECD